MLRTVFAAQYAVALIFLVLFEVSAASYILVLCFINVSLSLVIALSNSNSIYFKTTSWIGVFVSASLFVRQIPYMVSNEIYANDFYFFMNSALIFSFALALFFMIKYASDSFRHQGCYPLDTDTLYIVIKRPKSAFDYISCAIGLPVSSVSFCINGLWVRFKRKEGCAVVCDINNSEGYSFIDTGISANNADYISLSSIIGNSWSVKNNCVTSWYNITKGTFLEPKPWEWLPSIYVNRILKEIDK